MSFDLSITAEPRNKPLLGGSQFAGKILTPTQELDSTSSLNDMRTVIRANTGAGFVTAYEGGIGMNGWIVSKTVNTILGYTYHLTPPIEFRANRHIIFEVTAFDSWGNQFGPDSSYDFYTVIDLTPPTITNQDPSPNETDVPKQQEIKFSIVENVTTVDLASVRVYVRKRLVFSGLTGFQPGWLNSEYFANSEDGFDFILRPSPSEYFRENEEILITVIAANTVPLSGETNWTFTGNKKPFTFSVYQFVVQGVRKADDK